MALLHRMSRMRSSFPCFWQPTWIKKLFNITHWTSNLLKLELPVRISTTTRRKSEEANYRLRHSYIHKTCHCTCRTRPSHMYSFVYIYMCYSNHRCIVNSWKYFTLRFPTDSINCLPFLVDITCNIRVNVFFFFFWVYKKFRDV